MGDGGPSGKPCVIVQGLARQVLGFNAHGTKEENWLGDFFYENGCKVTRVDIVFDKKDQKSRGFAWIEFKDEASVDKACELDGIKDPKTKGGDVVELDRRKAGSNATLKVQKPRRKSDRDQQMQQQLSKEQDASDAMVHDLMFRESKILHLNAEIKRNYERQIHARASLGQAGALNADTVENELRKERELQSRLAVRIEELKTIEENLKQELLREQKLTESFEERAGRFRVGEEEGEEATSTPASDVEENEWEATAAAPSVPSGPVAALAAVAAEAGPAAVGFKSTRREPPSIVPPMARALSRTISNRSNPEETTLRQSTPPPGRRRWADDGSDDDWTIAQNPSEQTDVVGVPCGGAAASSTPLAPPALDEFKASFAPGPRDSKGRTGQSGAIDGKSGKGGPSKGAMQRTVVIAALPRQPEAELERDLRSAIEQLWRTARGEPPEISSLLIKHAPEAAESSWVSVARGKAKAGPPPEAHITFGNPLDARWLVEERDMSTFSPESLTLQGRQLHTAWPQDDVRKYRPPLVGQPPDDVASNMSYESREGTIRSNLSNRGDRADREWVPLQNRTVLLQNLPREYDATTVEDDVRGQLKRLWEADGFAFDPEKHLHSQKGIEVHAPSNRSDFNGGVCKVKFRYYADAKFLVDQSRNRFKVMGTNVRIQFARPREDQRMGGSAQTRDVGAKRW